MPYRNRLTRAERKLDDRILTEGLHLKHDTQIVVMRDAHDSKRAHAAADRLRAFSFPDSIRWDLKEQGELSDDGIETELGERQAYSNWKVERLREIVELLDAEAGFRADGKVERAPLGTPYWLDADNGNDTTGDGSLGNPWKTLHKFTETARVEGDVVTLRRGMAANYDDGSDLQFTSDGDPDEPIIIDADYDDDFGDHVNLNLTAAATLTFGSKTITFVAGDITAVLAAGDIIYVTAEDAREFAYEVDSVVFDNPDSTVTLFLPYKGDEAGSGKAMTNMQSMPKWNVVGGGFQFTFFGDHYWLVRGVHLRGDDIQGIVGIDSSLGHVFIDCVFESNGTVNSLGLRHQDDGTAVVLRKCRMINVMFGLSCSIGGGGTRCTVWDSLFDGSNIAAGVGVRAFSWDTYRLIDSEFKNHAQADVETNAALPGTPWVMLRNCTLSSSPPLNVNSTNPLFYKWLVEDFGGEPGDTQQSSRLATATSPIIQSETGTVRSGGGNISIKVTPGLLLSNVQGWDFSRQLLFEHAFYATTDSKQYDVYFRPTATNDWTADPTADELWVEAEYWGHVSNNFRRITKSTGVIDMNGSTSWAALSVTVQPAQAGVLYLRVYYRKTKEAAKANTFLCDPIPVVT